MQNQKTGPSESITNSLHIRFMLLTKNRFCPVVRGGKFTDGIVYPPIDSLNVMHINTCNKSLCFGDLQKYLQIILFLVALELRKVFFFSS